MGTKQEDGRWGGGSSQSPYRGGGGAKCFDTFKKVGHKRIYRVLREGTCHVI